MTLGVFSNKAGHTVSDKKRPNVIIAGNIISKTGWHGISAGSDAEITGNTVSETKGDGVHISDRSQSREAGSDENRHEVVAKIAVTAPPSLGLRLRAWWKAWGWVAAAATAVLGLIGAALKLF